MKTMLKRILTTIAIALGVLAPVAMPAVASAQLDQIKQGACLNASAGVGTCPESAGADTKVNNLIKLAINLFSIVVGIISVIMIIVGGLKYITSGGESGNVSGAKNTILYAVIGLVIVAMAQFIVQFVLTRADEAIKATPTPTVPAPTPTPTP